MGRTDHVNPDPPAAASTRMRIDDVGGAEAEPHHRIRTERGSARLSLNLTAMIDVVFLLLVYFMVATEFKAGEEIYRMDLPERQSANRMSNPFDLDDEPLRVHVSTTGLMKHACRLRLDGPYPQPGNLADLFEFLSQRQISPQSTTGLFDSNHPIVIVPTSNTRWEHAVEVFSVAARSGYTNISFGKPQ